MKKAVVTMTLVELQHRLGIRPDLQLTMVRNEPRYDRVELYIQGDDLPYTYFPGDCKAAIDIKDAQ